MTAFRLMVGDALEQLRTLPDACVQTCVTSPPYWGLRDYGVEGQIGLEPTSGEFIGRLLEVFRELRSDIVWHKPNPMPESVRDRPTVAHEFVFLLSKAEKYFYNTEAARERCVVGAAHPRVSATKIGSASLAKRAAGVENRQSEYSPEEAAARLQKGRSASSGRMGREPGWRGKQKNNANFDAALAQVVEFRNWRDVWEIPTQPSSLEHFAAFPEELARRCIVAGSREGDTVLDPFAGTGTTGVVALVEGRRFIGCELNPAYAEMAEKRSRTITPSLFLGAS